MDSILEQIQASQRNFDAFIENGMKLSTYQPLWPGECGDAEYSASKDFNTYVAEYAAAVVGSMIEKNADKPIQNMPTLGQVQGTLGRIGDRWQLDNDRLERLLYLEGRYRDRQANFTAAQRLTEFQKIVDYLFNPFEIAAVSPHKRVDMLYFEGLTNGTLTVDLANNPYGIQWEIDLRIRKYKLSGPIWNLANAATSNPITDIQAAVVDMEARGKIVTRLRMTQKTFNDMVTSEAFTKAFKLNLGSLEVAPSAIIPLDKVNQYFQSVSLPPVSIERKMVTLADGSSVNMFHDNRIVLQVANRVAKVIVADPLDLRLPKPNRNYYTYLDNLVSYYVNDQGRFVENEMWAIPVFGASSTNDFAILLTDQVNS